MDIWQCSEYTSSSEQAGVTQSSVENKPSYMFGMVLNIPQILNMLGLEYAKVVNKPRLHGVLCKLCFKDSQYFEFLEF